MPTIYNLRNYDELIRFGLFEDRLNYLRFNGSVGKETFGWDRYLNQNFYRSNTWRRLRNEIIIRDNGCDLGVNGMEIRGKIIIHHMNPITDDDISDSTEYLLDPKFLICTSLETHNSIHYGSDLYVYRGLTDRSKNDTCPWRKQL